MIRSRGGHGGFSLLEMLVSLTIMSIVVAAVYASFRQSNESWAQGTRFADQNSAVRSALDLVQRDLEAAFRIDGQRVRLERRDLDGDNIDNDDDGRRDEEYLDARADQHGDNDQFVDEDGIATLDALEFETASRSPGTVTGGEIQAEVIHVRYCLWEVDALGDLVLPNGECDSNSDPFPERPYALVRRVRMRQGDSLSNWLEPPQIVVGNVVSVYIEYMEEDGEWNDDRHLETWDWDEEWPRAMRVCLSVVDPVVYKKYVEDRDLPVPENLTPGVRTMAALVRVGAAK